MSRAVTGLLGDGHLDYKRAVANGLLATIHASGQAEDDASVWYAAIERFRITKAKRCRRRQSTSVEMFCHPELARLIRRAAKRKGVSESDYVVSILERWVTSRKGVPA